MSQGSTHHALLYSHAPLKTHVCQIKERACNIYAAAAYLAAGEPLVWVEWWLLMVVVVGVVLLMLETELMAGTLGMSSFSCKQRLTLSNMPSAQFTTTGYSQ